MKADNFFKKNMENLDMLHEHSYEICLHFVKILPKMSTTKKNLKEILRCFRIEIGVFHVRIFVSSF